MIKRPHFTINDRDYIPSLKEMGYGEVEIELTLASEYGRDKIGVETVEWMKANCERIDAMEKLTKEKLVKKDLKLKDHWYNTVDKDDIINAIDKTRDMANDVISKLLEVQTKQTIIDYLLKLEGNVLNGEIRLTSADIKKLKRFPKYDSYNKSIFGSNSRMLALWSHVFSLRK